MTVLDLADTEDNPSPISEASLQASEPQVASSGSESADLGKTHAESQAKWMPPKIHRVKPPRLSPEEIEILRARGFEVVAQ